MWSSSLIFDEWAGDDGLPASVRKDAATRMHEGRVARVIPGELKEPGLGESVDHAADPGPVDGARAHRARLARRVAGVARKVVVPDRSGRQADEVGLSVIGHVVLGRDAVLCLQHNGAARSHENRPERMVAVVAGGLRHGDRAPEVVQVGLR